MMKSKLTTIITLSIFLPLLILQSVYGQNLNYSGGVNYSGLLCGDGTVRLWGNNNTGQLGTGSTGAATTTMQTPAVLTNIKQFDTGSGQFGVALTNGDQVYAWGENNRGQLGNGTCCANNGTPESVCASGSYSGGNCVPISDVKFVTATNETAYAIKNDGSVWAWGSNDNGQIGDGTIINRNNPVQITFPAGIQIVALDGGDDYVLALDQNGCVWSWGLNDVGQLGDGTRTNRSSPVQVKDPSGTGQLCNISSVAAGDATGYAITTSGQVLSWGKNSNGQMGVGVAGTRPSGSGGCACGTLPEYIVCGQTTSTANCSSGRLTGVTQISGGQSHVIALLNTGEVVGWGANADGALGVGSTTGNFNGPQYVLTAASTRLTGITSISDGDLNGFAYDAVNNIMYMWGDNAFGQLGPGSTIGTDRGYAAAGWAMPSGCVIVMPVQLLFLKAIFIPGSAGVLVTWSTAKEENSNRFYVQKSYDLISWENAGTVKSAGNSSQIISYEFIDQQVPDKTIYYRLIQVDFDGKKQISPSVWLSGNNTYNILIKNPVQKDEGVIIKTDKSITEKIQLLDVTGRIHAEAQPDSDVMILPVISSITSYALVKVIFITGEVKIFKVLIQ
ncbi:MAG: RCC1 domain-containing protein [Cytophagaceae bacterium]